MKGARANSHGEDGKLSFIGASYTGSSDLEAQICGTDQLNEGYV